MVRDHRSSAPLIVDVFLDRPAILTEVEPFTNALLGNFGAGPAALLDVVFGRVGATGQLPFNLPSSMAAIEASDPDAPFDTRNPLFHFGHGLSYGA